MVEKYSAEASTESRPKKSRKTRDIPPLMREENEKMAPDKEVLRERLRNPHFLPTHADIKQAFDRTRRNSSLEWSRFCYNEESPIYEFLNEEFLNAFSTYLSERIEALHASEDSPVTILEVGAGNGRLSHFLREKLERRLAGKVKIIATDSEEWGLRADFPVETMEHVNALKKYQPQIVIYSWMPPGADMTADFRATGSVEEYLLIGETSGGSCGHDWLTWGYEEPEETWKEDERKRPKKTPPFVADGFEINYLDDISKQQIGRSDIWEGVHHSKTVAFRRGAIPQQNPWRSSVPASNREDQLINQEALNHEEKERERTATAQLAEDTGDRYLRAEVTVMDREPRQAEEQEEELEKDIETLKWMSEKFGADMRNLAMVVYDRQNKNLNPILGNEQEYLNRSQKIHSELVQHPVETDKNKRKGILIEKLLTAIKLMESTTKNGFRSNDSGHENKDSLTALIQCYESTAHTLIVLPYILPEKDLDDLGRAIDAFKKAATVITHKREALDAY